MAVNVVVVDHRAPLGEFPELEFAAGARQGRSLEGFSRPCSSFVIALVIEEDTTVMSLTRNRSRC